MAETPPFAPPPTAQVKVLSLRESRNYSIIKVAAAGQAREILRRSCSVLRATLIEEQRACIREDMAVGSPTFNPRAGGEAGTGVLWSRGRDRVMQRRGLW